MYDIELLIERGCEFFVWKEYFEESVFFDEVVYEYLEVSIS
jgi:hypothetical protein